MLYSTPIEVKISRDKKTLDLQKGMDRRIGDPIDPRGKIEEKCYFSEK